MKRRELMLALGGAAISWPFAARAQQPVRLRRVGIIDDAPIWDQFRQRLRELGHIEGRDLSFEYRVAAGNPDRLLSAAKDLTRVPVDAIAVFGSSAAKAAQAATDTVPIVAISIGDPIGIGLVKSLARPGGNITGNTILGPEIVPKRLQLLKELLPQLARVALFWNPNNASNHAILVQLQNVAPTVGVAIISAEARTADEFDGALEEMARKHPDAMLTTNDPVHQKNMGMIIDYQLKKLLPVMFQLREQVVAGGLMSYGASWPDLFRGGAVYVDKILKGAKPADLPLEQPTKFELVINLKTAMALGLTMPQSIFARADEVIE